MQALKPQGDKTLLGLDRFPCFWKYDPNLVVDEYSGIYLALRGQPRGFANSDKALKKFRSLL